MKISKKGTNNADDIKQPSLLKVKHEWDLQRKHPESQYQINLIFKSKQ
jgi:hypothetical protein